MLSDGAFCLVASSAKTRPYLNDSSLETRAFSLFFSLIHCSLSLYSTYFSNVNVSYFRINVILEIHQVYPKCILGCRSYQDRPFPPSA